MKFSVSSYSFSQAIQNGKMTLLDTVQKAAEMGFSGIEFTELKPVADPTLAQQLACAEELRHAAEKHGIAIVAYAIGAELYKDTPEENAREVERVCSQLDVAKALGAPLLRHDVCYSEKKSFLRMLPTIAENTRRITAYARSLGIRTCSENHGYVAQNFDRMEALLAAVNDDNYGLLVDIGNFACADEDPVTAVARLAPYAIHVHAKDFRIYPYGAAIPKGEHPFSSRACKKLCGCALGEGDIPVAHCIAILKRAKYDGYITVEYEGAADCLTGIRTGLTYLKNC